MHATGPGSRDATQNTLDGKGETDWQRGRGELWRWITRRREGEAAASPGGEGGRGLARDRGSPLDKQSEFLFATHYSIGGCRYQEIVHAPGARDRCSRKQTVSRKGHALGQVALGRENRSGGIGHGELEGSVNAGLEGGLGLAGERGGVHQLDEDGLGNGLENTVAHRHREGVVTRSIVRYPVDATVDAIPRQTVRQIASAHIGKVDSLGTDTLVHRQEVVGMDGCAARCEVGLGDEGGLDREVVRARWHLGPAAEAVRAPQDQAAVVGQRRERVGAREDGPVAAAGRCPGTAVGSVPPGHDRPVVLAGREGPRVGEDLRVARVRRRACATVGSAAPRVNPAVGVQGHASAVVAQHFVPARAGRRLLRRRPGHDGPVGLAGHHVVVVQDHLDKAGVDLALRCLGCVAPPVEDATVRLADRREAPAGGIREDALVWPIGRPAVAALAPGDDLAVRPDRRETPPISGELLVTRARRIAAATVGTVAPGENCPVRLDGRERLAGTHDLDETSVCGRGTRTAGVPRAPGVKAALGGQHGERGIIVNRHAIPDACGRTDATVRTVAPGVQGAVILPGHHRPLVGDDARVAAVRGTVRPTVAPLAPGDDRATCADRRCGKRVRGHETVVRAGRHLHRGTAVVRIAPRR